jgi:putative DNA primase/helicase
MQSRQTSRDANPDIAGLKGLRLVSSSEADSGARLNESLVKHLTGMAVIKARDLYQSLFEFTPTHKILLDCNYKPRISGQDRGIWGRIKLVPFDYVVPHRDTSLGAKLRAEAPGILAWAVRGCLEWQQVGLQTPPEVQMATETYRASQDSLGAFLGECVAVEPDGQMGAQDLYDVFVVWAKSQGEFGMSHREFSDRMADRGFQKRRTREGQKYPGFRLAVRIGDNGKLTPVYGVQGVTLFSGKFSYEETSREKSSQNPSQPYTLHTNPTSGNHEEF